MSWFTRDIFTYNEKSFLKVYFLFLFPCNIQRKVMKKRGNKYMRDYR